MKTFRQFLDENVQHQLFHGTTSNNIASIKESGLKAGIAHGASKSAGYNDSPNRRESVFLSTTYKSAETYAEYAIKNYRHAAAHIVVLTVNVPDKDFKRFKKDSHTQDGVYFHGTIPKEWITFPA